MSRTFKIHQVVFILISIVISTCLNIPALCETKNATASQSGKKSENFPIATPESQGLDSATLIKLTEAVQRYYANEEIVGAELLVIKNRYTVLHEVVGWLDREEKIPYKKNSLANIRSMTKPLTGAGIHLLIGEGKLQLKSRAADYLPGFNNEKSKAITIEQLLTHRSGLPLTSLLNLAGKVQSLGSLSDAILSEFPDLYSMTNKTGETGPQFEPESKFWYSDAGSDVLGAIIEVISEMSLDEFLRNRLLKPLGMNSSFVVTRKDSTGLNRVAALYAGAASSWSRIWKSKDGPLYPFAWGSQTLYSTPQDYARFLAMWMDSGMVNGEQLLSKQAVAHTLKPVSRMTSLGSDALAPTGFPGLETMYGQMSVLYTDSTAQNPDKPVVIGHSGSDGTFAWAWPEHDLMILYFTQSRGQATGLKLEKEIDKLLIHPSEGEEVVTIPARFKPFIGKYTANFGPFRNAIFNVLVQNDNLAVDVPGQMIFELNEPDVEGLRTFKFTNLISVSFQQDSSAKIIDMSMNQITKIPRKAEQDTSRLSAPEKYRTLLGKYITPMTNREMTILIQNDRLALDVPNESLIFLKEPDEKGRRFFEGDDRTAVFFEFGDAGTVTSMNLYQTFVIPKGESAAIVIQKIIKSDGVKIAISKYHELKSSDQEEYIFDERGFNTLGYKLLNESKFQEAIEIFKLNVETYPNSFNVYDSLGEAYMKNGDKELAIQNYQKSLQLNPQNKNGKDMLKKLEEM